MAILRHVTKHDEILQHHLIGGYNTRLQIYRTS